MTSSGERQRGGEEGKQGLVHDGASGGGGLVQVGPWFMAWVTRAL